MKVASLIAFPFARCFRRLELERRWWHRLSLVFFFTALPCGLLASAGLVYLTLAPQVHTMPDVWQIVDGRSNVPIPAQAESSQTTTKSNDSDWVGIPPPPDGSAIVEPEQSETVPIPPGAQIDGNDPQWVNGPASDDKSIQMPDGTTATFPGSMSNDAIKAHWTRAKNHQVFRAVLLAGLIAMIGTLILSYALQVAYRALLYVIFGGKPSSASESVAT